jgi:DNA-binding response OmpR family regulator
MNGVELIRALRAIDPSLPIVATSGLGEASRGAELAALKVTEVLSKPFDGRTLLALVHRLVSDRK